MARKAYGIKPLFLSPYSPFLNPIEYSFNKLKTLVGGANFHNRGELSKVISEKIEEITTDDAEGFYKQSAKYYSQCLLGLPFQGKALTPEVIGEVNPSHNVITTR